MNQAFGISEEDVYTVLIAKEVRGASWELAEAVFNEMNLNKVESAALDASDEIEEQTMAAAEEIWRQAQLSQALAPHFAAERAAELDVQLPRVRFAKVPGSRF